MINVYFRFCDNCNWHQKLTCLHYTGQDVSFCESALCIQSINQPINQSVLCCRVPWVWLGCSDSVWRISEYHNQRLCHHDRLHQKHYSDVHCPPCTGGCMGLLCAHLCPLCHAELLIIPPSFLLVSIDSVPISTLVWPFIVECMANTLALF